MVVRSALILMEQLSDGFGAGGVGVGGGLDSAQYGPPLGGHWQLQPGLQDAQTLVPQVQEEYPGMLYSCPQTW